MAPALTSPPASIGALGLAATAVVLAVSVALGYLLARRLRPPAGPARDPERREQVPRRIQILGLALTLTPSGAVVGGVAVLVDGGAKALGIGLLVLGLLVMAVPLSPFLRALARRSRE